MPRLTDYQFNELLKTESVTFLVASGSDMEPVQLHRGFAAYYSEFFAGLISKSGFEGTIELSNVSLTAVKMFARWCYQSRFDAANLGKMTPEQILRLKYLLIDLWIFGEMHIIPKLQNQTMTQIRALFTYDSSILTAEDVRLVFEKTAGQDNPLREIVMLILVVKIDIGGEKMEDYDAIAQAYSGFFTMFCAYQKTWLTKHGKAKPKDKSNKLVEMLEDEDMVARLRVPVPQPPEWVLVLSGAKPPPQKPGEYVELD